MDASVSGGECNFYSEDDASLASSLEDVDYYSAIDQYLDKIEQAAKSEHYYLLQTVFPLARHEVKVGLSPTREFTPAIALSQYSYINRSGGGNNTTTLGAVEWDHLMERLKCNISFFAAGQQSSALDSNSDNTEVAIDTYCKLKQLIYNDEKFLMLIKHGVECMLCERDVIQILDANQCVVINQVNLLKDLNFCAHYRNLLELVKTYFKNDKYCMLKTLEDFNKFCTACNLCNALKQFIFYYKDKILYDLEL